MRITNLTDRPTPALRQQGLVGVAVRVGNKVLLPGQTVDAHLSQEDRGDLQQFIQSKAVHLGEPPPGYPKFIGEALTTIPAPEVEEIEILEAEEAWRSEQPTLVDLEPSAVETPRPKKKRRKR